MTGLPLGSQSPNSVVFQGDVNTPTNCQVIAPAQTACVNGQYNAQFTVRGFHLAAPNTTDGPCLGSENNSIVNFSNLDFGPAGSSHISTAWGGGEIWVCGPYSISGAATTAHWYAGGNTMIAVQPQVDAGGNILPFSCDITAASLAFAEFLLADLLSSVFVPPGAFSFTGQTASVTGQRYIVRNNSVAGITTGDENFFPGNQPGTTPGNGLYVAW
jgi:hypothetical protein